MQRIWFLLCFIEIAGTTVGCGPPADKLVPVVGKITVDRQPLRTGDLAFIPDATKGNERLHYSEGKIQADGTYRLRTKGEEGAPLGWYKVAIWASKDPIPANPFTADGKRVKINWLTNEKYTRRETTDLEIEVVESPVPGRYDFQLTR